MAWADRATLIVGIAYGLFLFLLLGPQNPYIFSSGWFEGMAFLFCIPIGLLWIVLRLIFGNRGALIR